HASEPSGAEARSYSRAGGTLGQTWDLTPLASLSLDERLERVSAADPPPDTLRAGDSTVATAALGLDVDTRPDPILPYRGSRLSLALLAGVGDYEYLRVVAGAAHWFPLGGPHVLALALEGGIIAGDAPLFDRFYIGDLDPLLPPRALDLRLSTRRSPDFL